jgi:hypothetical protein
MKDPILVPNSFTADQMASLAAAVKDRLSKQQAPCAMATADMRVDAAGVLDEEAERYEALVGKCLHGTPTFVLAEVQMGLSAIKPLQRFAVGNGKFCQAGALGCIENKLKRLLREHAPPAPSVEADYFGPASDFNIDDGYDYGRRPLCGQLDSSGHGHARTRYTVAPKQVTCKKCAVALAKRAASNSAAEGCQ